MTCWLALRATSCVPASAAYAFSVYPPGSSSGEPAAVATVRKGVGEVNEGEGGWRRNGAFVNEMGRADSRVPENAERGPAADKAAGATKARRGMVRLARERGRARRRACCMRGLTVTGVVVASGLGTLAEFGR